MSGQESMPGWATAAFRLVAAIAAAGLAIMLVQFGVGKLAASYPVAEHIALLEGAMTIVLFGLLAAVALVGLKIARERLALGNPLGISVGLAAGVAGLAMALVLARLAGVAERGGAESGFGVLILAGTLLTLWQTGVEEIYFRGWLQPALQHGWGRWPGLIASALAFAALHLLAGATGISLLTITLAGLWFGLLAERSGGLALPIGAHFGWNWAEELLFAMRSGKLSVTKRPTYGHCDAGQQLLYSGYEPVCEICCAGDARGWCDAERVHLRNGTSDVVLGAGHSSAGITANLDRTPARSDRFCSRARVQPDFWAAVHALVTGSRT